MPEGDTVHRLAARMASLEGRLITASDFRVPQLATATLTGRRIERVWAWGKNLYWDCASGSDTLVLHTHLRMDGIWNIHAAGTRWRSPGHTARVVVRVEGFPDPGDEVELVGHELGKVELFPAREYPRHTGHLGPDPLDDDWDEAGRWSVPGREEALRRLVAQGRRSLGESLLDQSVLAGVGNVYCNELCFLLGAHPTSPAADVPADRAVDLAAQTMRANRNVNLRVFTGVNRPGHNTWVYGRANQPCRACGTTIRSGFLGGATTIADPRAGRERVSWWCPTCQPQG
ncbi:MAG: DNA-formamidopyrimidine glycosylase family protein [Propionibacteriaceae bacterium]|nr:DNA-formamidopyrimidine glycosylase family protein [Propionibacteriaceae bacterium]